MGGCATSIGARSSRASASDASEVAPVKNHTRERFGQHGAVGVRRESRKEQVWLLITPQV
jgi:hypothetical protein